MNQERQEEDHQDLKGSQDRREKNQDRREKLLKRKFQIEAQLQQIEAREKQKKRKEDARRKIIAGALALEHASIDPEFGKKLFGLLEVYVERSQDRALFGLAPKENKPAAA